MAWPPAATRGRPRTGVFVSYARSDGGTFAADLRRRLEHEGLYVWQDRGGMEGGLDWWLQITEALDRVEHMALVVTSGSIRSSTVRKEWQYARQQGVCVHLVLGDTEFDHLSAPRRLSTLHIHDLSNDQEWSRFLQDLRYPCRVQRVPLMVESLATDYVPRPSELVKLLDLLRRQENGDPIASNVALVGAGGYGKTTLARAACLDQEVQEAFDDGVLWVTLGESVSDLTRRLEDLIYTLSNERPGFASLEAAVVRFCELIADRDLLIVVDDVWERSHLEPFLQGGLRCARLITTRLLDVLPPRTNKLIVGAMHPDEAVGLLGFDLPVADGESLRHLAGRLGSLPMLLKLVNGIIRFRVQDADQVTRGALDYVDAELTANGLTAFDATSPTERDQAVARTIGVSLKLLTEDEQTRLRELSIFPEDERVPLTVVTMLWAKTGELDRLATERLCGRLFKLSLLQGFDLSDQVIRLHDVICQYLRVDLADAIANVHRLFLDAQRVAGGWGNRPAEEPYLWDWLAYHMLCAGLGDELIATVQDPWYLAVKTWLRGGSGAELDLLSARKFSGDRPELRRLEASFSQSRHLLEGFKSLQDLAVVLHGRLLHFPNLRSALNSLEERLNPPYLIARQPAPDLPAQALRRILVAEGPLTACAISADGGTLVGARRDGTLVVWNMDLSIIRLRLVGHLSETLCCAVSTDGAYIASGSKDKTLRVWDATSGEALCTLRGHEQAVTGCAFFPGAPVLVSASEDGTLKLWNFHELRELASLAGHGGAVRACAVHPMGRWVLSTSADRTIKWWADLLNPPTTTPLPSAFGGNSCAVSSDGRYVACGFNGRVWVFDLHDQAGFREFRSRGTLVTGCAVSSEGLVVASAFSGIAEVWAIVDNRSVAVLNEHTDYVSGCTINPRDGSIVTCSWDGTARIWDIDPRLTVTDSTRRSWYEGAVHVCTSSQGGHLLATADGTEVILWDPEMANIVRHFEGHEGAVTDCAFSADARTLVSSSDDRTLKIWSVENGRQLLTLNGHRGPVRSCCFSPDGRTIASGAGDYTQLHDSDNTVKLWNAEIGTELVTFEGHTMPVTRCAFSPDGTHILSASADGTVKVWNVESGEIQLDLRIGEYPAMDLAVAPAAGLIAVASRTGLLEIRTLPDGRMVRRIEAAAHDPGLTGCAMTSDATLVATVNGAGKIDIWDPSSGKSIASIRTSSPVERCAWCLGARYLVAVGLRGIFFFELVLAR